MNELKNKKLLIFGTGAVGGYYGGMLVRAGYDVTFVARGKSYEVLKQKGLILIRENEKEIIPINVVKSIHELTKNTIFDYIFICVKSFDTRSATGEIKNYVGKNTTIVSFQNGIENEDIIGEVVGIEKVVGALVFVASKLIEPGVVYQFGYNGGLIGELDDKRTNRILELQEIFQSSGIDVKSSDDIRAEFWNKLVWNASFNSISVLSEKTIDKILEDKELYELTKNVMSEVRDVAFAHGINLRKDAVEFNLGRSKGFTGFKTSMLQDYERGTPLELEEIVGVVIRKAKEKNVKIHNLEKVYKEVKRKTIKTTT